jgi:UDP-N-acetylmuramate dehydrogenase
MKHSFYLRSNIIFVIHSNYPMISLRENYSLKNHNTFGIDAWTRYFADIDNESDLVQFIRHNPAPGLPLMILGSGSNILFVSDYEGMIIHPLIKGIEVLRETSEHITVRVGAGELWDSFVEWTVRKNYGGIENLSLIPGSVGASPIQNIGAYGSEAAEVIEQVGTIQIRNGRKKTYSRNDCRFGYRTSIFKTDLRSMVIITHVVFKLSKKPVLKTEYGVVNERLKKFTEPSVSSVREVIMEIRNEKLPDPQKLGNAGSFFKNPVLNENEFDSFIRNHPDAPNYHAETKGFHKIPAAWLIEQCGWKGRRIGDSGTFPLQPLVLVNYGNATGKEIYKLSEKIREDVLKSFGIQLEREVNTVGISA